MPQATPPAEAPESRSPSPLPSFNSAISLALSSLYLLIWYAVTLWLVVGTLSAYLFLQEAREKTDLAFPLQAIEQSRKDMGDAIDHIWKRMGAQQPLASLEYLVKLDFQTLYAAADIMSLRLRPSPESGANTASLGWSKDDGLNFYGSPDYNRIDDDCPAPSQDAKCEAFRRYTESYLQWRDEWKSGYQEDGSNTKAEALYLATDETNQVVSQLKSQTKYIEFFGVLDFYETWRYEFLLSAPHQVLVMILTMAMGILGSLLSMTWANISRASEMTGRQFVMMPFVGMMSAFTVMVILKAGQLSIGSGNAVESLSPYFLSFVGIISGLTSEMAHDRISASARRFFQADEAKRWNYALQTAMDAAEIDPGTLARYMTVPTERLRAILDNKAPATLEEQRLASACLRQPIRDLFSDMQAE